MVLNSHESINFERKIPYLEFLFKSLLWNNENFKPFQYFCFIISNTQCLAITVHITFNCVVTTNYDNFSYVVKEVFRLLALQGIISFEIEDYATPLIIFSVTLCYFAALFGLFARDAWNRKRKLFTRSDNIMAYFTQFHLFIGFWLICTLLLKYITLAVSNLIEPGLTAFQIFILIFSLIFLVLNYLFGFVFAHFSYDPFISSNVLSSHSSNFHMFTWIFQAVIAPMLTSSDPSTSLQWALITMSLILLAVRCGYLVYSFPYYNYWAMKMSLVFGIVGFAMSVVNAIAMIVSGFDSISPTTLICIVVPGCPLLIKATTILLDGIAMSYLTLPSRSFRRKEDVFKQIFAVRCLMSKAVLTVNKNMNRRPHEIRYLGAISHFYKLKTLQFGNTDNKGITLNEICERSAEYSDKLTMEILQDATKRFRKTNHFKVLLGHFSLTTDLPFLKTSLLVSNPDLFKGRIKIAAVKVHKMLQEKIDHFFEENKNEVLNLKGFLECQAVSVDMNEALRSITLKYIQFWTQYLKPQIIIKDLYKISHDIELEAAHITNQWNTYTAKNKMLAHSLCNVYSTYLSLIRGSPQQAIKVMNKNFLNNLEEVLKFADEHSLSNETLISSNIMALYGSMNSETPGKIVHFSSNINEILGWGEIDLSNQYAERIMPLFMREEHKKMVTNHINLAIKGEVTRKLYTTQESFVLHKLGHTVPCETYISIHPFVQKDPMYMVLLRKRTVIQDDFLLINQGGIIDGYSRELGHLLGLNLDRRTSLRSICQDFTELNKALYDVGFQGRPHESFHKSLTKRTEDNLNNTEDNGTERIAKIDQTNKQQKIVVNFCVAGEKRNRNTQKYTVRITPKTFGSVTYFLLGLEREFEKHNANSINNFQSSAQQSVKNEPNSEDNLELSDLDEHLAPVEEFHSVNPHSASKFWESHKCMTTNVYESHKCITTSENVEKNLFSHHGTETSLLPNLKKFSSNPLTINTRMNSGTELSVKMKLNKIRSEGEEKVITPLKAKLLDQTLEKHEVLLSPVNSGKPLMVTSPKTDEDKIQTAKLNKERMKMQLSSSMGSSTKNYMNKLEHVVKDVPINPQVKPLYLAFLLLITLSVVPLIVFHFQNASVLNHVQGSIENISSTIFRMVRITDLSQTVRQVWATVNGLFSYDRYYSLGFYTNNTEGLLGTIAPIISDINQRNNEIRQSVYGLDPSLQDDLYSNRVPIFEMDNNGSIVSTRSGILLDVVTELVSKATNFLYSGLPFTKFNPYMLFIFNNTINYVLRAGQQAIPIIMNDNELKLSNQSAYIEAMIICLGVLGFIILVLLGYIQRQLVKDRSHFLNIFLMLKDQDITNQLNQAQEFLNTIEEQSSNLNKNQNKQQKFEGYSMTAKAKTRQLKRNASTTGLNSTLIILFIKGIALFILLLTGYIIILESVKSKSSMILSKMNLMITSDMDLFHINLLLSSIYEYIQNNGTTGLEGQPFSSRWEEIYAEMISSQDFLLLQLLAPGNGLSDNAQLNQIITGDLCDMVSTDYIQLASLCPTVGGGAALRGMIGLNSYYLSTARTIKDYYDHSAMSQQDKIIALSSPDLVNFEAIYSFTLEAFTWVDALIRSELVKDISGVGNVVLWIVIGCTMAYIIAGGWLCHKIKYGLDREPAKWRRLLMQIPYMVIVESKLINAYLVKTSNGALVGGP